MDHRVQTGARGEQIAASYLRDRGYALYERNVRLGRCEIDIVAFDPRDRTVVFVEVKSRSSLCDAFHPLLGITPRKKRALHMAMDAWVARHAFDGGYRLDIVCVAGGGVIEHIEQVEVAI